MILDVYLFVMSSRICVSEIRDILFMIVNSGFIVCKCHGSEINEYLANRILSVCLSV